MGIEPLIIKGRIVTLDKRSRVIEDGALYVGADEKIAAIRKASEPAPEGFESARVLDTGGSVYPGLIDLHNHIAYNTLPLWASPTRTEPWGTRDQWPDDPDYKPSISLPANAYAKLAGEATLKYVETKAVIGGTTAIQGSAKVPNYDGWLVRNVEKETFKKAKKISVRQSVRELEKPADFAKYRKAMDDGYSFIYHLAEGKDPSLIEEFDGGQEEQAAAQAPAGHPLLGPDRGRVREVEPEGHDRLVAVLEPVALRPHHPGGQGGRGRAADLPRRRLVAVGGQEPARRAQGRRHLQPRAVRQGASRTSSWSAWPPRTRPRRSGWQDTLGSLTEGLRADVVVTSTRESDPYRNLITATEKDVEFVAINGYPFYGTRQLMSAAGATHAEPIQVGPPPPDRARLPGLPRGRHDLEAGPRGARQRARGPQAPRAEAQGQPAGRQGGARGAREVPRREGRARQADARDRLAARARRADPRRGLLKDIERRGFHGGLLDGLRDYYR